MKELLNKQIILSGSYSLTIGDILNSALILFVAWALIRFISVLLRRFIARKDRNDSRHASILQLVRYFIWTVAIVFVFQSLGFNITILLASSAALLVGIGLGLQNIFKDFISGIILLMEGTIAVNDIVDVDGQVVQVNEISLRTSKVTTRDDNVVIIPNHKFVEEKIVNWTNNMRPTRFQIDVGVDYGSDPSRVEQVMLESARAHPDVLQESGYSPSIRLHDFGDSSLDFQLIFYSYNLFRIENVKSKIRLHILEGFRQNGITIPFPQRVLHTTTPTGNSPQT
jgi:small-conductance mechanosensitive channel